MLADEDLNMHFPDGDIHNFATFKEWYDGVIYKFFDEIHTVHSVKPQGISDDQADVEVIVGWQANWWELSAAKSKRVALNSTQTWIVRRSTKNAYGLEIVFYNAEAEPFKYAPGFAKL